MSAYAEVLKQDIEAFGLIKNGQALNKSMLAHGWNIDYLINIRGNISALVLENESGTDAVWYFDERNIFIGSSLGKIKTHRDKIDLLFKVIFIELLSCLRPSKEGLGNIFKSIMKNSFFYSEFLFACDYIKSEESKTVMEGDLSVNSVLFQNGRDLQDKCITSKSKKYHTLVTIHGETYTSNHGIVINDFSLAYPLKGKNGDFCLVIEGGHHSTWQVIFMEKTLQFYHAKQPGGFGNLAAPVRALIHHMIAFSGQISDYVKHQSQPKKCGIIRNAHIGHSLWNDISALQRVADKGIANALAEIIVVGGEASEPWIGVEAIVEKYKGKVNRKLKHSSVAQYIYENNLFPIRLTDNYIKKISVKKIVNNSKITCDHFVEKQENELRVVFGLRVESRTWVNQEEGLIRIAQFLVSKFDNLTLVIDGHDFITTTGKVHSSLRESSGHGVVDIEKKLVHAIQKALKGTPVRIIDAVAMSIECSVAWIDSSDFFIAPWGAGLAKYKWISNLPGVIFTSKWNMAHKNDLDIYENPNMREGATSCTYVDGVYVTDETETPNLIPIPGKENSPARENFYIDPKGIEVAIEKVLTQIGRA